MRHILSKFDFCGRKVPHPNAPLLESELLKVDGNTTTITNPIDIVNKENRTARRIKQAGVSELNILESKRERKPNNASKYGPWTASKFFGSNYAPFGGCGFVV
jgi:hypothetical protein